MTVGIKALTLEERVMDRLPTEIIIHILREVVQTFRDDYERSGIGDLKALRLSCKTIALLAADLLFSNVSLFMDERSFTRLALVSSHTSFRNSVQSLHVYPMLRSENLIRKEIYYREVKRIALTVSNLSWLGVRSDGCRELLDDEIEAGYMEYLELIDNQTRLRHLTKGRLCDALRTFRHLHTIEAGLLEVFIRSTSGLEDFEEEALGSTVCGEDVSTLMVAIALSRCTIQTLALAEMESSPEIANFTATFLDLSPADFRLVRGVFEGLKTLSVKLLVFDEVGRRHAFGARKARKCQRLLKAASKLEKLVMGDIGHGYVIGGKNMFTMVIGPTLWPCLQELTLFCSAVEESPLSNLLCRHKTTLRRLYFKSLVLTSGSWYKILASLRGNGLVDFEATHLASHLDATNQWMLGEHDEFSCDAVRKFVLGEIWSPKLDPRLSRSI